jgi:glutaminyl-peptide cyclotransferase
MEVVDVYPHDVRAFTQGLAFDSDGRLFESSGGYRHRTPSGRILQAAFKGGSTLREVDLITGRVIREASLPDDFFAEGIAIIDDKIYQLTWKNGVMIVWDKNSLEPLHYFVYNAPNKKQNQPFYRKKTLNKNWGNGEGWGLTTDGRNLIMSDGTDKLYVRDPETFSVIKVINVTNKDNQPVYNLNELEYVNGTIWANIWPSPIIAQINALTGKVMRMINLDGLLTNEELKRVDVLNGIAYDKRSKRFFVTGKLWPKLFEMRLL